MISPKLIVLGAGHSNVPGKDMGAAANGYIEGVLAVRLRQKIAKNLKWLGANYILDNDSNILKQSLNYFRKLTNKNAIVVDIHFNAGPPSAKGTESLIPTNHTIGEQTLGRLISKCTSVTLNNTPMRGILGVRTEKDSHHSKLGWMTLEGENVVWEVEFITNKEAMDVYIQKEDELAENIAHVLYAYSINHEMINSILQNRTHKVRIGDTLNKIALLYSTTVAEIKRKNKLTSDYIAIDQILSV